MIQPDNFTKPPLQIYLQRNMATQSIDIYMLIQHADGTRFAAAPVAWEMAMMGHALKGPTVSIPFDDTQALQRLVNELAAAGIVADVAQGSAGELSATRYHLEDMRSTVDLLLGTELKKKPKPKGR